MIEQFINREDTGSKKRLVLHLPQILEKEQGGPPVREHESIIFQVVFLEHLRHLS